MGARSVIDSLADLWETLPMPRPPIRKTLIALTLLAVFGATLPCPAKPPNFVVILVDDLCWDELYNLKDDPYEMVNRITDPHAQAILEKLRLELNTLSQ